MIKFREVQVSDAKMILDWRTSDRITKFLNSDMKYDLNAQSEWLEGSLKKSSYYHWIIQYGGKDVGLLNFVDWNPEKKSTSWGFYIGEEDALGIGGIVPPNFYNFAFNYLGVERILAQVFYNNTGVIDLHLRQGYNFDTHRDHVIQKNGQEILMVCMTLEKKVFQDSKFSGLKQELPISCWKANPNA